MNKKKSRKNGNGFRPPDFTDPKKPVISTAQRGRFVEADGNEPKKVETLGFEPRSAGIF